MFLEKISSAATWLVHLPVYNNASSLRTGLLTINTCMLIGFVAKAVSQSSLLLPHAASQHGLRLAGNIIVNIYTDIRCVGAMLALASINRALQESLSTTSPDAFMVPLGIRLIHCGTTLTLCQRPLAIYNHEVNKAHQEYINALEHEQLQAQAPWQRHVSRETPPASCCIKPFLNFITGSPLCF